MPKPIRPSLVSSEDLNNALTFIESIPVNERRSAITCAWQDAQAKLKETKDMCIITHALHVQHPDSEEVKVELVKRVNLYAKFADDVVVFKSYLDSLAVEKRVGFKPIVKDAATGVIMFPQSESEGE